MKSVGKHKRSREEVELAVKNASSFRQTLINLGITAEGGNYRLVKKFIKVYDIDTSHFTGQLWSKGKKVGSKIPLEDYLSNKRYIKSHALRLKLLNNNVFEPVCTSCKNTEWLGEEIPLELDHIDGNYENNSLINLRLLCPNCHAKTPNWRGKKKKKLVS